MIKSINFINYKSFDNLDISDINFENINLIFGYNGHGKSSFADFLYQSINNNILDNFNCSQQKYKIYIYNERYKRNVLYIDDDEKYDFNSFYAGENIKDIIKQKSKIEEKIAKLKIFEDRNEKDRNNVNIQIDNLKISIAKRTREVLEKINPQAYKTPQSYTKASIQNVQFYNAQLLDSNEFDEIKKLTINNKPNEINIYNFNLIDKVSFNISELNKILKETPENYAIEKFKNDIELENFARTALKIKNNSPQEYNDKCPLCGQSIIQVKLWETLEKHFNKEYDNFVKKLEEYADFFESVKNEVNNFKKWLNENLINSKLMLEKGINIDELRQEYINLTETFNIYLDNTIINTIQEKIKSPNRDDIDIELNHDFNRSIEILQSNKIKDIIDYHNKQQSEYKSIIEENITKIINHFIAEKKDSFLGLQEKNKTIDYFSEKISICKEKREKQINCIENELKEVDESFKNLNEDLNSWFFSDIKFVKISDTHYKIQRQDSNGCWFDCKSELSEGEKTIISLIYFINSYLATSQDLEEYPILIIDDPITSLDNTNKDKIINYILNKIVKNKNIRSQIFILSHEKYILHKIDKELNRINFSKKKILNISKHKFISKIDTLRIISFENGTIEIYNKLKEYIDNPKLNIESDIMEFPRRLLEKIFSIVFEDNNDFTKCYDKFLERYKIDKLYTSADIQKLNHNKSDEDLSPEVLEKCKFVIKIFEKFTNPYKDI